MPSRSPNGVRTESSAIEPTTVSDTAVHPMIDAMAAAAKGHGRRARAAGSDPHAIGDYGFGPTELRAPVARRYVPGSNVLETSWMTDTGWMIVHDALVLAPRSGEDGEGVRARELGALDAQHMLVRTVECVHGTIEVEALCEPAFDYATEDASWRLVDKDGLAADVSGGGETPSCA
jgi:hypothetical protein